MKRTLPCLFILTMLLLAGGTRSSAQVSGTYNGKYNGGPNYNDLQLWENIYIEKNLTQKMAVHINEEGRAIENITLPNYIYADFGLTYKPKKWLHLTIAYVPIAKGLPTGFVSYRHQFYGDYTLKLKYRHFVFYDREMFQWQYNDINRSIDWNIPGYYLRSKVTVKYKAGVRYIPYVAAELYWQTNKNMYNGEQPDRARYYAGCFYRLDAINELELYYLIEPHFNIPASYTNFVIGVGYAYNLY